MQRLPRIKKELQMLENSPPHGITCYPVDENITHLEAKILGPDETPYVGGIFKVHIDLPERYPFEPPKMHFVTPVYHPNIDNAGRICLDTLKMPPKGTWRPCLNLMTVLSSVRLLMANPNPADALMADIATEMQTNQTTFMLKAEKHTLQYAREQVVQPQPSSSEPADNNSDIQEDNGQVKTITGEKRPAEKTSPLNNITNKKQKTLT